MNTRTCMRLLGGLVAGTLALAAAPGQARADESATAELPIPEFRLSLRGQLAFVEEDGWQALADSRLLGGGEVGLDAALGERLFVGLAYGGRALSGRTFAVADSTLSGQTLRGSVGWRWQPLRTVQLYGRAGVGAWWWDLVYTPDYGGREVAADTFRPGFFAGAGVDLWLLGPEADAPASRGDRFAIGVNFELTYDRFLPLEFTHDGRTLGTLDPSGPGLLMGMVMQF